MSRRTSRRLPASRVIALATAFAFVWSPACSSSSAGDSEDPQGGRHGGAGARSDAGSAGAEDASSGASGAAGSGPGGSGDGSDAGAAGVGPGRDEAPPEVVSITPEDGASDIERDAQIVVELSEAVEPTSVASAVDVIGPAGELPGEIRVEDATITFRPDAPFVLLGRYTVSVAAIADRAGNRRAEVTEASFLVRDGRFGEPESAFEQEETGLSIRVSAGNRSGDVFIGGIDAAAPPRAWGAVFDRARGEWGAPERLAPEATLTAYVRGAALADSGDGVVSWWHGNTTTPGGWYAYTRDEGFTSAGPLEDTAATLTAVSEDRRALAVTQDRARFVYYTLQDLKSGAVASRAPLWDRDETLHALLGVRNEFVLVASHSPEPATHLLTVQRYARPSEWDSAVTIAETAGEPLDVIGTSDELGNIAVLWVDGSELWLCAYSAETDSWADPAVIPGARGSARWSSAAMVGGTVVASFSTLDGSFLARYDDARGWDEEATLALGPSDHVAVTIDPRGNALAVHGDGKYRRYVPGLGWQEPRGPDVPMVPASLGVFAARDGSAIVVGTSADDQPQRPLFVRFD